VRKNNSLFGPEVKNIFWEKRLGGNPSPPYHKKNLFRSIFALMSFALVSLFYFNKATFLIINSCSNGIVQTAEIRWPAAS
jgi:hypothetical protein